jgi:hypothetical protein
LCGCCGRLEMTGFSIMWWWMCRRFLILCSGCPRIGLSTIRRKLHFCFMNGCGTPVTACYGEGLVGPVCVVAAVFSLLLVVFVSFGFWLCSCCTGYIVLCCCTCTIVGLWVFLVPFSAS